MGELSRVFELLLRAVWLTWFHAHPDAFKTLKNRANWEVLWLLLLSTAGVLLLGLLSRFVEAQMPTSGEARRQLIAQLKFLPKLVDTVGHLRVKATRIDRVAALGLAAGLLVVAASAWPYDAYLLCKCIVFIVCGKVTLGLFNRYRSSSWPKVLGLIAILYNPFLPIHFHRSTWVVINLLTAAILTVFGLLIKPDPERASQTA